MKRVYSEFIRKQKTAERAEKACEDAMKETGKVIQKGCLSLTLPK